MMKEKVAPEFINRIDDIVMFLPLGIRQIEKIVRIQLATLAKKLKSTGLDITFDDSAILFLSAKGYVPEYGARPVKRAINELFINELTMKLLEKELDREESIMVSSDGEQLNFINIA